MVAHLLNRFPSNRELGSFFPGMNETDRRRFWIDNVNGAAISHVDPERDLLLIGDQTIVAGELLIAIDRSVYDRDPVGVNLLNGEQRPISDSNLTAKVAMNHIQSPERFRFIRRNVDSRNARDERVTNIRNRVQCRKEFASRPLRICRAPCLLHRIRAVTWQWNSE